MGGGPQWEGKGGKGFIVPSALMTSASTKAAVLVAIIVARIMATALFSLIICLCVVLYFWREAKRLWLLRSIHHGH